MSIEIKDYTPFHKASPTKSERGIFSYIPDNQNENDIDSYFDLDLSEYEQYSDNFTNERKNNENLSASDYYDNIVREVIVSVQKDLNDYKIQYDGMEFLKLILIFCSCTLNLASFLWSVDNKGRFRKSENVLYFGGVVNLVFLIKRLKELALENESYEVKRKELQQILDELSIILKSNQELLDKFNSLYEEYVCKVGKNQELDELYNEINKRDYRVLKDNMASSFTLVKKR